MQSIAHALNSHHREKQEYCPDHGQYTAIYTWLGDRWVGGGCPHCLDAQRQRQRREDMEQRRQQRTQTMIRLAGIPERYQDASFEAFDAEADAAVRVREACRRYAETFPERLQSGTNLILSGGVGTGKTHLGCAIARYVIAAHQRQARYATVSDAVRQVRRTYDRTSEQTEQDVFDWLAGLPLLVLDEVGVQTGSEHERMVLFEIFNRRYSDMRPTVVISNLGCRDLTQILGERVIDRLLEDGTALAFTWASYRSGKR